MSLPPTRSPVGILVLGLAALSCFTATPTPARAQDAGTAPEASGVPEAVTRAVTNAVAARWGVPTEAVRITWPAGPAMDSGAIRLLGSGAAGVFVVEARGDSRVIRRRVTAGVRSSIAVAARDLQRGAVLADTDIAHRDTVLVGSKPDGPVAGWVARRAIPMGAALASPAVGPASAVVAGRPVTLVWRSGELEVSTRAVAVGTAAAGERVAVRTESGRRIWGIAEAGDVVTIVGAER